MESVERWGGREQLWLAAAVARGGGWVAVSRALRACGLPPERCSARRCAAQYTALQSRRPSPGPQALLQRLTADRVQQLQHLMAEEARVYAKLRDEVLELLSPEVSDARIRAMAATVEQEQLARRRARRAMEPQTRPSPLLTSLLQPATPSPTSPLRNRPPAPICRVPSPSTMRTTSIASPASAPSIARVSEPVQSHELEKIEQIKSELQKIEEHLKEGTTQPVTDVLGVPLHPLGAKDGTAMDVLKNGEKIDIDDIEIKAEDVYAFSDIDLDIPPVSSIHKTAVTRISSDVRQSFSKKDINEGETSAETPTDIPVTETGPEFNPMPQSSAPATFETDEKAEKVDLEVKTEVEDTPVEKVKPNGDEEDSDSEMDQKVSEIKRDLDAKKTVEVTPASDAVVDEVEPQPEESADNSTIQESTAPTEPVEASETLAENIETDDDTPIEVIKEDKPGKKRDYSRKKSERDDIVPIPEIETAQVKAELSEELGSDNSQEALKTTGRKLRGDLSGSRSESPATPAADSLPGSPAPMTPLSDAAGTPNIEHDKDYRIWKKSVIMALNRMYTLKYASLFSRKITDEQAPGYSQVVKKPMDLATIKRNIETGAIRTMQEFQRDILLMLTNALMYNRTDHRVYSMALETVREATGQLNLLLQAHSQTNTQTTRLTRPPRPASRSAGPAVKRKRGGGDTPTSAKKRKSDEP